MGEPRLFAAVPTVAIAPALRPLLMELTRQVAEVDRVLLVTSGASDEVHAEHVRQGDELGVKVLRGASGASAARNAVLNELEPDDVVGFLDDDVMPAPDWLSRLGSRWVEASERVACIGGAVVPRWLETPPAWMSERLHPKYALLDLGQGVVEMDPHAGLAVWGANMSLRVGTARAVGGFPAEFGPRPGAPLIGEESALECALQAAGLTVLYAGDIRAEHRIGSERLKLGWLATREFYRGITASEIGPRIGRPIPRPRLRYAIYAFKALTGTAIAALRRDRPLAAERFVAAANDAGVAIAPLWRRRVRSTDH